MFSTTFSFGFLFGLAQEPSGTAQTKPNEKPNEKVVESMPPLPADAHAEQTIQLNGKTLKYTVTVGTLPALRQGQQEERRRGVHRLHGRGAGSSGDLRVQRRPGRRLGLSESRRDRTEARALRRPGRQPVRPRRRSPTIPAPGSTSPICVFIDPIGTGFSRSYLNADDTKREFYTHRQRHPLPLPRHLRLAGQERAPDSRRSTWSARATAATAARASPTTCRRSSAWR